jgi:hypothetical protein
MYITYNSDDFPMKQLNVEDYSAIALKTAQVGIPRYFFYNRDYPLGTIKLYGVPSATMTLNMDSTKVLTAFADLTTVYDFAPGYKRAMAYGLLREICPELQVTMSQESKDALSESVGAIKDKNLTNPIMKTEVGLITSNAVTPYPAWLVM